MELKPEQAILKLEREPDDIAPSRQQIAKAYKQENKISDRKFTIVAIGASAGGLNAIEAFFLNTPSDTGMAFVVITHLDPKQKDMMPEIIQRFTTMKVCKVTDGMKVQPNRVYVIPPNKDMSILHGTLLLLDQVRTNGLRLPIDFFFQSLAKDWREHAVGIVLSGMGSDGTLGLKIIMENFGLVMVQDPKTAEFDSMPLSAIATDFVDYILPPYAMPGKLLSYINMPEHKKPKEIVSATKPAHALQKIYVLLRTHTGHDFSLYKRNTVFRRIERRMGSHQITQFSQYVRFLQENPTEIESLFKELLIGVTKFFRDHEAFKQLEEKYLPEIIKSKKDRTIRVWVAGCSTGEEAYSIAILLRECLDKTKDYYGFKVQIFASDIDQEAVDKARNGIYQENIEADVSPDRLRKYFNKVNNFYHIKKDIREMVVFAVHNINKDAPFTKLDMIGCRNLLIYFSTELQKRIIPVFHYALNPLGLLFLGSSETISGFSDLFETADAKWKISRRNESAFPLSGIINFPSAHTSDLPRVNPLTTVKYNQNITVPNLVQKALLDQFVPPSVIVNLKGDIFYINGRTGKYLEPAPGQATMNIFEMAREGLKFELNSGIYKAGSQHETIVFDYVLVKNETGEQPIRLTIKPLELPEALKSLFLVIFEEIMPEPDETTATRRSISAKKHAKNRELENELMYTKQRLQSTIEEMQSSLEELKSTNEELQSANEELQSTNEEAMTNKEEMQSLNEELMTINIQYQTKADELLESTNDMKNLLDSTQIGTIFLDSNLKIRNYTPQATQVFNLIRTDVGRPITDIASNLKYQTIAADVLDVMEKLISREIDISTNDGQDWFAVRILPYRTMDNFIDGTVLTFTNVTKAKKLENDLKTAWDFAENIIETVRDPLMVLDVALRVVYVSKSFSNTFQIIPEQIKGHKLYHLGNGQWNIPELIKLTDEVLATGTAFNDYLVEHTFPIIGYRKMLLNARRLNSGPHQEAQVLLAIQDITESKAM